MCTASTRPSSCQSDQITHLGSGQRRRNCTRSAFESGSSGNPSQFWSPSFEIWGVTLSIQLFTSFLRWINWVVRLPSPWMRSDRFYWKSWKPLEAASLCPNLQTFCQKPKNILLSFQWILPKAYLILCFITLSISWVIQIFPSLVLVKMTRCL